MNHRCTSAKKGTSIYERCWCKGRTTFWDLLEKTAIRGAEGWEQARSQTVFSPNHCRNPSGAGNRITYVYVYEYRLGLLPAITFVTCYNPDRTKKK